MSTRAHSNALLNEPSVNKYKYSYGGAAGGFYGEGAKFNKQTAKWVPPRVLYWICYTQLKNQFSRTRLSLAETCVFICLYHLF